MSVDLEVSRAFVGVALHPAERSLVLVVRDWLGQAVGRVLDVRYELQDADAVGDTLKHRDVAANSVAGS